MKNKQISIIFSVGIRHIIVEAKALSNMWLIETRIRINIKL